MIVKLAKGSRWVGLVVVLALTGSVVSIESRAAGGDDDGKPSKLTVAKRALDRGDYEGAIAELKAIDGKSAENPDVLNLLGYSHRKLGHLEKAREYYLQALKLKPKHRGANEYLGELYLQTGELEKAEERLAVLDKACFFPCEEYTELKEAIAKYKADKGIK